MSAYLENSAAATGLEKVSFIPIPKKGNAKECSNYHTIALISHTSKVVPSSYCSLSHCNLLPLQTGPLRWCLCPTARLSTMGKGGHKYSGLCRWILLPCQVGLRIGKERPRRPAQAWCLSTSGSHIEGASRPATGTHPLCPQTWASYHLMCHL